MPTVETARNVTVVGAGIVGVACALSLQREGHKVTIVDRLDPGEATSAGNAGVLSAASCVPMSMPGVRSEEHTSELQSLMRISYAVFCLKNKTTLLNTQALQ